REGLAIFVLVRGGDGSHGASVEAVLKRKNFRAKRAAFRAEESGVRACDFQRGLNGLGSAVAEEGAVESGGSGEAQSEWGLVLVKIEVRDVDELTALLRDGVDDGGMPVAERVDADAAQQVEVAIAVFIDQVRAFAAGEEDRV